MNDLPPLPVAIPFTSAALLMATASLLPRKIRDVIAIATATAVTVICGVLLAECRTQPIVYWFGDWRPHDGVALGISFVIDPLGAGLATLVGVIVTLALVFSWRFFRTIGALYSALMLVFQGAMSGFCLTGDLFNLFVFFELMSVTAYALTAYKIEEEQALMGAFEFAVTNSVGAFLVLVGIGLLYGRTGALNMAQIGRALAAGPVDCLVITASTFITCGFGVKAALVPFQFWLADAHAVAPTPVCTLFSGVMVELGLYAVARIYWSVFAATFGPHADAVRSVWLALGVLTAITGGVMCFSERHLKRMLAFSTVSHTGLILIGVALLTPQGLAGSAQYVLGHGLVKSALFLMAGILLNRYGSVDENELRNAGRRFPVLGVMFLIGGLALAGLPPFGAWLGKSLIEDAASRQGYGWLTAVLILTSAMTGGAVIRSYGHIFLGLGPEQDEACDTPKREDKETKEDYDHAPAVMFTPALVLVLLALTVGIFPGLDRDALRASVHFEDQREYCAAVLDDTPCARVTQPLPAFDKWNAAGLYSGVGAAIGALLLACLALNSTRIPRWLWNGVSFTAGWGLTALRGIQSGKVSDYITWLVVGVAGVGAAFVCLFGIK